MQALTEDDVRERLANATDEERELLTVPTAFYLLDWDHRDFVGWRDPKHPDRAYLFVERGDEVEGIILRAPNATSRVRNGICNLCRTMQPADHVAMFSARKGGAAGQRGDSIGTYICADLTCHEGSRLVAPLAPGEVRTGVDRRIDGTRARVERFVDQVLETRE